MWKKYADIKARRAAGEKGFTLVELLVVVVILAALAAIAVPIFMNQKDKADDSVARSNLTSVAKVLGQNVSFGETVTTGTKPVGTTFSSTEGGASISTSRAIAVDSFSSAGFCIEDAAAEIHYSSTTGGLADGLCP